MKPVVINRNSWHWRLAHVYGPQSEWDIKHGYADSCEYVRSVLSGLFKVFEITLALSVVAAFFGDLFSALTVMVMTKTWFTPDVPGIMALAIILVLTTLVVIALVFAGLERLRDKIQFRASSRKSEPGFVSLAFQSWKDKYCMKVTFDNTET